MRRKRNAGKGFGMSFHGAFASKADAKKKERQVHGFIQPRNIRGQRRYVVMSERKNPIRRKKKAETNTYIPGANPLDLVVMGANPRRRELTPREEALRHRKEREELIRLREERYKRRGTRNPEIVVEPGQTITLKINPSAESIREEFVGRFPDHITIFHEPHMPKGDYAKLGDLVGISYKPKHGGQVQAIGWYEGSATTPLHEAAKSLRKLTEPPQLVSDESGRQLYFVGGNQDCFPLLDGSHQEHQLWELGKARTIIYRERKHFDDFELINYEHKFGEETGERPTLMYDGRHRRLFLEGGAYEIKPEGITN